MSTTTNTMSIARAIAVIRKRWYLVLAAAILGGVGAFAVSNTVTPTYHSTASLYFSLRTGSSGSDINQGSAYTQAQMLSFARLATSSVVLDPVSEQFDGELTEPQLRRLMSVTIPQSTVILDVRVGSTDRRLAALVANRVADSLITAVDEVAPADADGNSTVSATVIEPAEPAIFQTFPNKQQDALLGAIAGFILACAALVFGSFLDTRVRSESALKSLTGVPILASIERFPKSSDPRPVALRQPDGRAAASVRRLRSALRFASASHETRSIVVTSSVHFEGKSSVAANLAVVVAETGARVLLIDANLRTPRVAEMFSRDGSVGLTTVLVDSVPFRSIVQPWAGSTLDILPSGEVPPNPVELLESARMSDLIREVVAEYDLVVIDTAPVLAGADALVMARQVDSTVVIVDYKRVRRAQLTTTLEALERSDAHISGLIPNGVKARARAMDDRRDAEVKKHTSARPKIPASSAAAE
ncbi:polysaccharide biosynthesis tyrosine autokinase [Agromyces albus]|uniref:non-specific protein-tyrosine kinase n=1 Tax=Agromyces albus TaxID=205332 RepID=A0A4Q2L6A5_9MICO|nr:polysaccharide biosynthesis tyrosine autokinase [Agromyces albus]RXZ71952.1 polysaccharide biosynthesis tyrosine autokinase [Agromyces albus]